MTVEEGLEFFSSIPKIARKLQTLYDVGLGYIRICLLYTSPCVMLKMSTISIKIHQQAYGFLRRSKTIRRPSRKKFYLLRRPAFCLLPVEIQFFIYRCYLPLLWGCLLYTSRCV